MNNTFIAFFQNLSDLSDELQLILSKESKIIFANRALKDLAQGIENADDIFVFLGFSKTQVQQAKSIEQADKKALSIQTEIKAAQTICTIRWKISLQEGNFLLIGTDLGINHHYTEGEKFAQALQEINAKKDSPDYTGHLTDIQQVLAEEVDKFKLISENVSDIVCLHEPREARYVYVSPACKEVTGYTANEMEGHSPYDFFHPEMIKALQEDHRRRETGEIPADAPSGPPPKMIYLFKTKDRGFRWMESHSRPIFDAKGNVILILSTSRDVHEREEAEKEKNRYSAYYRTLGSNIPNGAVFMIDRDYNYLIADGEEFDKLGRASDYYIGKNAKDLYTPERYKRLSQYLEKLFAGESVAFDWDFNNQNYVFLGRPCIEADGSIPTAILLTQNVTESRQQAAKLKMTLTELEAKNFELDSFVYRTSHDLRSPLASVLGLSEIILKEENIQNIYDCTIRIRESIKRLDTTIGSILEYSRNGNLDIQKEEVHIQTVWQQCVEAHKNMPGAEAMDFLCEVEDDAPIQLDVFRVTVIFNNLISNAIKYSATNKPYRFVKLTLKKSVNGFQLMISDNGVGIPKDHLSRVFNMFYRATSLSQGAGLGLYIAKQAIDKLGGVVLLDSKEGEGTTFTITIPSTKP